MASFVEFASDNKRPYGNQPANEPGLLCVFVCSIFVIMC